MPVPKYDEMFYPVLRALSDGKAWTSRQVQDAMADHFHLSDEDKADRIKSGMARYANNALWAATYLKNAGLIENVRRGVYRITQVGSELLATGITDIDKDVLKQYPSFVEFIDRSNSKHAEKDDPGKSHGGSPKPSGNSQEPTGSESPEEAIESSMALIRQKLADELLDTIMQQSPSFFEELVVHLLCAMGYGDMQPDAATVTKQSGDGGIDGIVREDRLGFSKIYVQAKRWEPKHSVGSPDVQAFVGALSGVGADKGLFITTATFSKNAREYATKQHTTKLVLVDGQMLANLMIDHNVGVTTRTTYELKAIDRDFFEE